MKINKRTKYKSDINKNKKPTKKYMSLIGKTVFGGFSSNMGQSVWNKKFVKSTNGKSCIYVRSKCYDPNCNGYLVYDKIEFKYCNLCGLGTTEKYNISYTIPHKYNDDYNTNKYNFEESISQRNKSHDLKQLMYMDYYDPKYKELQDRNNRIIEFERGIKSVNGKEANH
jgi:hypothetical protein